MVTDISAWLESSPCDGHMNFSVGAIPVGCGEGKTVTQRLTGTQEPCQSPVFYEIRRYSCYS